MFSFFKKKLERQKANPIVVARIKNNNFLSAVNSIQGMTEENIPIVEPIVGDLLLTYAIDTGENYISISPTILKDYNLSKTDLLNLSKRHGLNILKDLRINTDGQIYQLAAAENMTACTILFSELWQQIESELGCNVIVSFAHRDSVLYARTDSESSINALKVFVSKMDFTETHALSEKFFRLNDGQWQEVSP